MHLSYNGFMLKAMKFLILKKVKKCHANQSYMTAKNNSMGA